MYISVSVFQLASVKGKRYGRSGIDVKHQILWNKQNSITKPVSLLRIEIPFDAFIRHKKYIAVSRNVFASERSASEEVQERELKFYAAVKTGLRIRQ